MKNLLPFLDKLKHSPIHNYGIPGLTSWLIGQPSETGTIRLFECSREHQEPITPHSHRFDFHCVVLAGSVRNILWESAGVAGGDEFMSSDLGYGGEPGKYDRMLLGVSSWSSRCTEYRAGDEYSMSADQVHSIFFSRGASVLFFEGPKVADTSTILEPFVDGHHVLTFQVAPWMFLKGAA